MRNFNNIFVDNNTDFRINSESSNKQNNERFFHFKTSCYSNCVFLVMSVLAKDNIIRCCEYFIEFSGVVSTLFIICNSISLNATVEETNFSDNLSLSNKIDNIISVSLLIFLLMISSVKNFSLSSPPIFPIALIIFCLIMLWLPGYWLQPFL